MVYKLKKSKNILLHTYHRFNRKKNKLTSSAQLELHTAILALQEKIMAGDREGADHCVKQTETLTKIHLVKTSFEKFRDLVGALAFALFVAVLVRSMLIEPYEIPSGSMRPTFQEQDRLVVSKTNFGVNIPLMPKHFYFDPELVMRAGTFIFTGANMDIYDVNTMYFYLFPGKKQFVKRMMGKPGDTLYFYGGKIYGIDQNGKDISQELEPAIIDKINHVPFIHLDGKVITGSKLSNGIYSPIYIAQMNERVAKLEVTPFNTIKSEMLVQKDHHYFDLWGFKNYAIARLLTKDDLKKIPAMSNHGELYLELIHHPNLENATIERDPYGRVRPTLGHFSSIIPLSESELRTLFSNLYTARFVVKDGAAYRWGSSSKRDSRYSPKLDGVPNGTYEFLDGAAYEVQWGGILKKLPLTHPLYVFDLERVRVFFNIGMEFDKRFLPEFAGDNLFSSRYSFFRDGDLYVMNAPLLKKGDSLLEEFLLAEQKKESAASTYSPYYPFIDEGAPTTADIKEYGLTVPDKHYLALGDNYANSGDTRDFGFVPEDNIRGAPSFIFWPPGSRFGLINQLRYPFITGPSAVLWSLTILIIAVWTIIHRRRNKLPLDLS